MALQLTFQSMLNNFLKKNQGGSRASFFFLYLTLGLLFSIIYFRLNNLFWYDEILVFVHLKNHQLIDFLFPHEQLLPIGGQVHYYFVLNLFHNLVSSDFHLRIFNFFPFIGIIYLINKIYTSRRNRLLFILFLLSSSYFFYYLYETKHYFFELFIILFIRYLSLKEQKFKLSLLYLLLPFSSLMAIYYALATEIVSLIKRHKYKSSILNILIITLSTFTYYYFNKKLNRGDQAK